ENMKLKYFISTAFILGVSANAQAQKWFNCKACPAGTYSDGIHGCKTCTSSAYSSWGGNCGPVTRTRTDYCQATGSTSSTANSKTVTENGNYGNNCSAGYYCPSGTNKNCTQCSAGQYSNAGASSCSTCKAGTYSKAGASSCTPCTGNTYSSTDGATSCTAVPANTSQSCKKNPKVHIGECNRCASKVWPCFWGDCCIADAGCLTKYAACELLTPGILPLIASQAAALDVAGVTVSASTPGGACYIAMGILSIDWGTSGTQSVTYSVNSTHTGYTTSYGSCN
nr:hypothetical protein [bacterium]